MSSFAQLMALSKAKTEAANAEVQATIQRREEKARAAREAAERKEREEKEKQEKLRQAQAELERRQKEKERQRELAQEERQREVERKQREQMEKILGKSRHQAFESRDKEAATNSHRKKKATSDDEENYSGPALTRAEKRALKMDPDARPAWAQKLVGTSGSGGKPTSSGHTPQSPHKSRRVSSKPVNFTKVLNAPSSLAAQGDQSLPIKERLKQSDYFTPIKLSSIPRDKRTQADYFQEKRQKALVAGRSDSPGDFFSRSKSGGSGSDSRGMESGPKSALKGVNARASTNGSMPKSVSSSRVNVSTAYSRNESPASRKRARSESFSSSDIDSDFVRKRPKPRSALSSTIWQMVTGKDRSQYVDDVFSDDDDDMMEVSAAEVAREEAKALVIPLVVIALSTY